MPTVYKVKQGDCISSIAFEHDLFPEALWGHPENTKLKEKRKDPNALFPGDEVFIPDKTVKTEACASEQTHRFRRKGVPERLLIKFLDDEDDPLAGMPYRLDIQARSGTPVATITGETDDEGVLEEFIPPDATRGELALGEGEDAERMELLLGHLDPAETMSGIESRLSNMGYRDPHGLIDNEPGTSVQDAIRKFQADNDLEPMADDATEPDKETVQKIEAQYTD